MIWLYVGLAIFLAAAGGGVVWKYNSAVEEAAEAKAELVKANAAAKGWEEAEKRKTAELAVVQKTLAQRERDRRSLMEERDHARGTIEALRKNPEVRDWARVELPPDVVAWVRGADGSGAPAKAVVPGPAGSGARIDSGAKVPRADKR